VRLARFLAVAVMAAAPVAWAQYDNDDYDLGHDREAREDMGRYYRIEVPTEREMKDIRSMAQRLDNMMEGIQADVRHETRHMDLDRMEDNAIRWLDVLTARVDAFKDATESNMSRPHRTTDEMEKMLGAFFRVNEQFRLLRGNGLASDDFRQVRDMVNDIASYYGGVPEAESSAYYRLRNSVDINDTDVGLRIGKMRIELPSVSFDSF